MKLLDSRRSAAIATAAAAVMVFGSSRSAHAEDAGTTVETTAPPRPTQAFGAQGAVVLDDLLGIGVGTAPGALVAPVNTGLVGATGVRMSGWVSYSEQKYEAAGAATSLQLSTLSFAPSFDVFIARNVSIGSRLALSHSSFRTDLASSATGGAVQPRIGWVMPLTEGLYFWPRIFGTFGIVHAESTPSTHGAPAPDAKQTMLSWGFGAEASLVVPLGRVVALTFGPTLAFSKTDAVAGEPAPTQSSVFLGVNGAIALTL
jgi:hypothetical protein